MTKKKSPEELLRTRAISNAIRGYKTHMRWVAIRQEEWLRADPDDPHGYDAQQAMLRHIAKAKEWESQW